MKVYNIEETTLGNHFRLNYELARQMLIIWDILNKRFLDATAEDVKDTIIEKAYVFDNAKAPKYNYQEVPEGIRYYIAIHTKPENLHEFVNWFLRNKQQPRDYLIPGTLINRWEKRGSGEDKTVQTTEYGGIPLEVADKHGVTVSRTFKKF